MKITRRHFLGSAVLGAVPVMCGVDGVFVERRWLRVRELTLAPNPSLRVVHFTDTHFKGDAPYMRRVIAAINEAKPDYVLFTGDIVEDSSYLDAALEIFREVRFPMYGVPGNHDYWSGSDFSVIEKSFKATGGDWLVEKQIPIHNGFELLGITGHRVVPAKADANPKTILLSHYPDHFRQTGDRKFALALAGHSHGGQVRIPFYGALIVPERVGIYDMGLFHLATGPLYVNPGIGTWHLPIRFCCRPEVTILNI